MVKEERFEILFDLICNFGGVDVNARKLGGVATLCESLVAYIGNGRHYHCPPDQNALSNGFGNVESLPAEDNVSEVERWRRRRSNEAFEDRNTSLPDTVDLRAFVEAMDD